jgi:hypothetical protein
MDEILESLSELVRSLSRLHNNNKGLLLNGDIDRLEKAKAILSKNATGDERGRVKPSNENGALPIPDVSKRICPKAGQCANTPGGMICPKDVICPI